MLILGLDTSGLELAVVLLDKGSLQASAFSVERRGQGEFLLPQVTRLLQQTGRSLVELSGIAVVTGPGSFTGLRLGLAAALGLGRALDCPLAGYSRFVLLRCALAGQPAALVLDSLRDQLFVEMEAGHPEMLTAAEISARHPPALAGDGAIKVQPFLPSTPVLSLPVAAVLAAMQLEHDLGIGLKLPPLVPCYLREPDVTFPAA